MWLCESIRSARAHNITFRCKSKAHPFTTVTNTSFLQAVMFKTVVIFALLVQSAAATVTCCPAVPAGSCNICTGNDSSGSCITNPSASAGTFGCGFLQNLLLSAGNACSSLPDLTDCVCAPDPCASATPSTVPSAGPSTTASAQPSAARTTKSKKTKSPRTKSTKAAKSRK